MSDSLLLVAHAGVTLAMVGVMWTVQLVVYPQFRSVSAADFGDYVTAHSTRIVSVLAVVAPAALALALLVFVVRPDGTSALPAFLARLLLAAAWIGTGLWYAPIHGRLQADGRDPALIERLIATNWVRSALWSARGVLALIML